MARLFSSLVFFSAIWGLAGALNLTLTGGAGNASSPLLYGLLFEDVYHSGDGGLYAELIQNRAFQGTTVNVDSSGHDIGPFQTLDCWYAIGEASLVLDDALPALSDALPWHMRVDVDQSATGATGFWNLGFWGMNVTAATEYTASFYLRGDYDGVVQGSFWSNTTGSVLASTNFTVSQAESDGWIQYQQTFEPGSSAPDGNNTFHLTFDGASAAGTSLRFNLISVFPETWHNSKSQLREDLADALYALNGKYLRMPGGNNLEGQNSPWMWKWNATIGPLTDRPGRPGTWGYYDTDGFGLLEMMQWCLDMGLETILAVWDGEYLDGEITAQEDLQVYINDTLNELEFLLGPATSTYGAQRVALGYTDPFVINYVEIGNEDFLNGGIPSYISYRFSMFYDAIKEVYPDMKVISSIWEGYFDPAPPVGVIQDLHDYLSVSEMVGKYGGYDHSDRDYPVLVGEYAAIYDDQHIAPNQLDNPTLQSATSEAIYFLGLERNADVIVGISHGALIKSLHDEPDNVAVLKHNPTDIVYSMSYYVIKLFANNYGSETVPMTGDNNYGPLYWSATMNSTGTYFIKVVNFNGTASTPIAVSVPGASSDAKLTTLTAPDAYSTNTLGNSTSIWTETTVPASDGTYQFTLTGEYVNAVLAVTV